MAEIGLNASLMSFTTATRLAQIKIEDKPIKVGLFNKVCMIQLSCYPTLHTHNENAQHDQSCSNHKIHFDAFVSKITPKNIPKMGVKKEDTPKWFERSLQNNQNYSIKLINDMISVWKTKLPIAI